MSLLLDQGLPRSTVQQLAALGIVSQHVGDLGMASATDAAILAYAVQHNLAVVTWMPIFTRSWQPLGQRSHR